MPEEAKAACGKRMEKLHQAESVFQTLLGLRHGTRYGKKQPPGGVLKPSQEPSTKGLENSRVCLKQSSEWFSHSQPKKARPI